MSHAHCGIRNTFPVPRAGGVPNGIQIQLEAAHGCIGVRCGLTRERWHVRVSLPGM